MQQTAAAADTARSKAATAATAATAASERIDRDRAAHLVHDVPVQLLVRDARLVQAHVQVQVLQAFVVGAHINDARQHPPAHKRDWGDFVSSGDETKGNRRRDEVLLSFRINVTHLTQCSGHRLLHEVPGLP